MTETDDPNCAQVSPQSSEDPTLRNTPGTGQGAYSSEEQPTYRDAAGLSQLRAQKPAANLNNPPRPQPLTEFQMLVAGSLGRIVPQFGVDLFANAPVTFTPELRIPPSPYYSIGPGDQVLIHAWGQVSLNLELTVDRSGSIYIPQVGAVRVAGLHYAQLQEAVRSNFARIYRNFDLNVNLGQLRSIQVFVTGQARHPGSYTLSALSTLVTAAFAAGGPSPSGSMRHILLRRKGEPVVDYDLYDLVLHGDKGRDVPLESGDVVFFANLGPQIAVTGSVLRSAIYELRDRETVADALALAGGSTAMARGGSLLIERTVRHPGQESTRAAVEVATDSAGLATSLEDADLIRVRASAPRFSQTVTLRGYVASPGRFAWRAGLRVRDLIPDQDALLAPDYWLRREQLGLPVADFQPYLPPTRPRPLPTMTNQKPVAQPAQQPARGLFPTLVPPHPQPEEQPATQARQSNSSLAAVNNNKSENTPQSDDEQENSPDAPTQVAEFPVKTTVVRSAPEINWSYAVIERLDSTTLTPKLVPFNLGAAVLEHDDTQNLPLEAGDVITVFSVADIRVPRAQEIKYIRLEGEFKHAGVYSAEPGETLRQLVQRAGGITDQAYLYGSQFTRESTRRQQQLRLDEYTDSLARQVEQRASSMSSSVVNAQAGATLSESLSSQRALVNSLRSVRATGRIVLHFQPTVQVSLDSIPDVPLEDGDRFVIPAVPSTVSVVGAVYDQNAFLYNGHRVEDYLRQAGGPTRDADRSRAFVIHADGSVISRSGASGTMWSGNSFSRQAVYPGDTIIMPQVVNKTTLLRGLTDWSAVMSQFALGAAAINVIR